jgi:glucosamine-6-phosphate isomerase
LTNIPYFGLNAFKDDCMELKTFPDHSSLSNEVALELIAAVKAKPDLLLCLASGDTPLLSYIKTIGLVKKEGIDFSKVRFVALDEWVGIPPDSKGSCNHFLRDHLFQHLPILKENIRLFDAMAVNLQEECRLTDQFILKNGPVDFMVVGIGMNGHIGFNEPGIADNLVSHVINLDEMTKAVGQKYFPGATALTKGITLGFGHIMRARKVIMVANGKHKAEIVASAVEQEITTDIPASLLRRHRNSYFFIDSEAASRL